MTNSRNSQSGQRRRRSHPYGPKGGSSAGQANPGTWVYRDSIRGNLQRGDFVNGQKAVEKAQRAQGDAGYRGNRG